ncbi:MAG: hypothetical protein LZF60_80015 [Nitrospira sp.]|nr:MAG: hypothetical protein LZF60_80015 [Nitrospira sp.]
MQTRHHRTARPDRILRGWVVLWLLALPLFHIHPETDPHHGEAGHVHAAAVHTVFSGDLEGEFGEPRETAPVRPHAGEGPAVSTEGTHAWSTDPELSLFLLNDATDRKLVKPLLTHLLFVAYSLLPVADSHDGPHDEPLSSTGTMLFTRDVPARAPPSPFFS